MGAPSANEVNAILQEIGVPKLLEDAGSLGLTPLRLAQQDAQAISGLVRQLRTSTDSQPAVSTADIIAAVSGISSGNAATKLSQMVPALKSRYSTHTSYWKEKSAESNLQQGKIEAGLAKPSASATTSGGTTSGAKDEDLRKAAEDLRAAETLIKALNPSLSSDVVTRRANAYIAYARGKDVTDPKVLERLDVIAFQGPEALSGTGAGGTGGGGGGGGYVAPTTYGFQQLTSGGKTTIWKQGSDGSFTDTGIPVDVPLQNIQTDDAGNLVGYDPATRSVVVLKENFTFPKQDPSVVTVTDKATGKSYALNTRTGERRDLGTYDFPSIDPERTFQQGVQAQSQATASGLRGQDINAGVTQRGQDVNAGLTARGQDIQSSQYGTDLGLKKSEIIRQILANPADYVSRAWLSAGKAAPGGTITQADLMNALTGIVGEYKQPTPYVAPTQYQAPGIGSYAGQVASAWPISLPKPIPTPTPTPTPTTATTPAPAAPAANFGGFTLAQLQAMQNANVPAYAFTPEQQKALGITYTPTAAPTEPMKAIDVAPQASSAPAYSPAPTEDSLRSVWDTMSAGGMTNEPAFIVGDARDGHKTGYEEMIVNPTGAPLKVVPNSRLPRFAKGSDSAELPWWLDTGNPLRGLTEPIWKPNSDSDVVNAIASMTSPLNLALMALPGGAVTKLAPRLLGATRLGRYLAPKAKAVAEAVAPTVSKPLERLFDAELGAAARNVAPKTVNAAPRLERMFDAEFGPGATNAIRKAQSIASDVPEVRLLPERATIPSVIESAAGNTTREVLARDLANFTRTPGMFNRLPRALSEARGALTAEARPYTRSEVESLFKRVSGNKNYTLSDNAWNAIQRIQQNPESAQVMMRGLPSSIEETVTGPITRLSSTPTELLRPSVLENAAMSQRSADPRLAETLLQPSFIENNAALNNLTIDELERRLGTNSALQRPMQNVIQENPDITRANFLAKVFNDKISGLSPRTPFSQLESYLRKNASIPPNVNRYFAEGTGYLPRYAAGSEDIVGAAGSGATGVTPADVSMGYLSGPAYDWYDAETGGYGYGAFNPGSPEPNIEYPAPQAAPSTTVPQVAGAPAGSLKPITQQDIVSLARQWSPPSVSAVLGEGSAVPRQLPVRSASMRQTSNLTSEDVQALGSRLAAEGTSLTDYNALQQGLFGAKRGTRRGRLVI